MASYDFIITSSLKSPDFFFPTSGLTKTPSRVVIAVFCRISWATCGGFLVWNATIFFHPAFEKDSLVVIYELMQESTDKKAGGDFEASMDALEYKIINKTKDSITIKAPSRSGAYRFYVYVSDNFENVATANIPFYVK